MPHNLHSLFAALVLSACITALEEHNPSPHVRFPRRDSSANTTSILDAPASSIIEESPGSPTSLSTGSLESSSGNLLPTVSIKVGPPRSSNEHPVFGSSSTTIYQTTSVLAEASTPGRNTLPALVSSSTRSAQNEPGSTATSHHGVRPNHTSITYWGTGRQSACSSFLTTCSDYLYLPVTSTILWTNSTTTITAGDPTPRPVLIQPLPLCGNVTSTDCPTSQCGDCLVSVIPAYVNGLPAVEFTILVTKKSPAAVTVSASPVSFSFGSKAQPTVTQNPASTATPIPIPVPFLDHTGVAKVPTSEVDSRITTSFVTMDNSVPTSPPVNLPPGEKSRSGDASVEPTARLAGIASAIAAPSSNVMDALSHVLALLDPVTDPNSAVTAPGEIAAAIAPSGAVVDGHTFVAGAPHTTLTINGQAITVEPSQIIAHGTRIALPVPLTAGGSSVPSPTLSAVTVGSITFSLGPSAAIIGSLTHFFSPGEPPLTTIVKGQTVRIGANGIEFASTTVAIPIAQASPTVLPVVAGGLKIDIGSNKAIINGVAYAIGSGATAQNVVIGTETLTFGPGGISLPTTTIPPYYPLTVPSPVVVDGLTFSIDATQAVISGTTYAIGPGVAPKTAVFGTETVTFGPGGISLPTTTIPPYYALTVPSPVVVDGLTFSIDATQAVISGTTYAIGPGVAPKTVVFGTETVTFGPGGISLPTTTIPPYFPPAVPSPVVVDGLTFSIDATQAVISGTTYAIGPGAVPRTVVFGTETVSLGPGGIGLPTTTLAPPSLPSIAPTPMTADGLTFSIEPTDVIIGGSTYAIGSGAPTETLIVSGETVVVGPGGLALPTTTIAPSGPSRTGLVSFTGAASIFGPVLSSISGCLVCFSLSVMILS